jgi:hypothetical protein
MRATSQRSCVRSRRFAGAAVAALSLLGGCHAASAPVARAADAPAVDVDAALAAGLKEGRSVLIVIAESGRSPADDRSLLLGHPPADVGGLGVLAVDIANSGNRAAAARFHALEGPVLVVLSPRGVILSRDEGEVTAALVLRRAEEAEKVGPEVDRELARLEAAGGDDVSSKVALAEFWRVHGNAREAIPYYRAVAHLGGAEMGVRVRAWVDLVRAHQWIVEPEKGRHEAKDLLATLGPTSAEARAGANLLLGIQDANAKRYARAREEFGLAVEAAPTSAYAKEAAGRAAKLRAEGKSP